MGTRRPFLSIAAALVLVVSAVQGATAGPSGTADIGATGTTAATDPSAATATAAAALTGSRAQALPVSHTTVPRVVRHSARALTVGRTSPSGAGTAGSDPLSERLTIPEAPRTGATSRPLARRALPHVPFAMGGTAAASRTASASRTTTTSDRATSASRPTTATTTAQAAAATPGDLPRIRSDEGFFGISDADDSQLYLFCDPSELCEEPPDPGIAVDTAWSVQSVNELLLVTDRSSGDQEVIDLPSFFQLSNAEQEADPHVLKDTLHDRWVAAEISWDCSHSFLNVAVSATDDPLGVWNVYRLVYPGKMIDYPGMGTTDSLVMVGVNVFVSPPGTTGCMDASDFAGSSMVVLDWAQLYAGAASLSVTTTDADPTLATWRPSASSGSQAIGHAVVAIQNDSDTTADIGFSTVTGSNAAGNVTVAAPINVTVTQGIAAWSDPPQPHQPGDPPTIATAVDNGPTDAISGPGRVFTVASVSCRPAGDNADRTCVRVTELSDGAVPTVLSDTTFSQKGFDLFMGGVGRATDGTTWVEYSRSSPTSGISNWATYRSPASATFGPPALITPGFGTYDGTRWGDWNVLAADPVNPSSIWQADEVPAPNGSWLTWVSRLSPADPGALEGTMTIEGDDTFVDDPFVLLDLVSPPKVAVTVVRASNRPDVDANGVLRLGRTLPVADAAPWSLTDPEFGGRAGDGLHRVYIQWGDGAGHWSALSTDSIILDTTPPTSTRPTQPRLPATALQGSAVPLEVSWTGATDSRSSISSYNVTAFQDGEAYDSISVPASARTAAIAVPAGAVYEFEVTAMDGAGNTADGIRGLPVKLSLIDDRSTQIAFSAGWTSVKDKTALDGRVRTATAVGSTATLTFTGRSFGVVAPTGPKFGQVDVSLDGRSLGRFDLASRAAESRQLIFVRNLSASAGHTVVLTVVGTPGRPRVNLDGFALLR